MNLLETIRVCLIEVGHWHSGMYVDALVNLKNVEVVGVSDRDLSVAKRVGEKIGCAYYTNYLELLARQRPDFVFAFGIHKEMPKIIESLIDRGISFTTEKPAGTDYRLLEPLVKRVEREELFASVAFAYRCSPWVKKVIELRNSKLLGDLLHGYYRYITGSPQRYVNWGCSWMLNRELSGGGCTINLAIHYIDLARYITGSEVKRVYASMENKGFGLEIEDLSVLVLDLGDRSVHTIEVGYCNPARGWNSTFSITTRNYTITVYGKEYRVASRDEEEVLSLRGVNIYEDMVRETIERFREGIKPIACLRDCLEALRVVNKAYESDARGKPIILEET